MRVSTIYRIRDWDKHFENNRTRELKKIDWIPVPNKHDGSGFCAIMAEKDGMLIYAAWHLILQVASKCDPRGTLMRDSRTPHTARTIALKTRCNDPKHIQRALDFCASSEVGWIEALTDDTAAGCGDPAVGCEEVPMKGREGKEGKGTASQPVDLRFSSPQFIATWESWKQHRKAMKKPLTDEAIRLQNKKLPSDEATAIAWIENAIEKGWQGIYEPNNGNAPAKRPTVEAWR